MASDQQIQVAAAAAAEKVNGGKFSDPLFYKPEHQKLWGEIARAVLDAAKGGGPVPLVKPATAKELKEFSEHCTYVHSVYAAGLRVWKDSTEAERKTMEAVAPRFFENFGMVLGEFLVMAASRITDPPRDARNNESLSVELFLNSHAEGSATRKRLAPLYGRIMAFRKKILPARHKLTAHADRAVIAEGKALLAGTWAEWNDFWSGPAEFVRILNEASTGKGYDIQATNAAADAEALIRALPSKPAR